MRERSAAASDLDLLEMRAQILETISDSVLVADETNRIVFANEAVASLLGWSPSELVGRPLVSIIPERYRARHLAAFERFMATGQPTVMGHALRVAALRRGGGEVDVDLTLSAWAGSGRVYTVGVMRDVAPRILLEREAELVRDLLRVIAQATTMEGATGELLAALSRNGEWQAGSMWITDDSHEHLRCIDFWHEPGLDVSPFERATRSFTPARGVGLPGRAWSSQEPLWVPDLQKDANYVRRRAAERSGLRTAYAFPITAHGTVLGVIEMVSSEQRPPDTALLSATQAIAGELGHFIWQKSLERDLGESNRRLAFLAHVSQVLASSLDHRETIQQVAQLSVAEIADWATIDLVEHGTPKLVAAAHALPGRERTIRELRGRFPPHPQQLPWVMHVLRTGSAMLHEQIDDELIDATVRSPEEGALLKNLGLHSAIVVPLGSQGQILGTLAVARGRTAAAYTANDVRLAEELGRRVAIAIEQGRLYEKQAYIARTLQRALLPPTLPEIEGAEVAASYRAARGTVEVGGDFYDVFRTPQGWAVVIGDVSGKGVEAAALTARVRFAIRSLVTASDGPAETLRRTNDAILPDLPEGRYCTVSIGVVRLAGAGASVTTACAGHPPPLIARAGRVEEAGAYGQALGLFPNPAIPEHTVSVDRDDLLLFYTDGVSDCWSSEEAFRASVMTKRGVPARVAVRDIESEALDAAGGAQRDDMALVALRVGGLLRA